MELNHLWTYRFDLPLPILAVSHYNFHLIFLLLLSRVCVTIRRFQVAEVVLVGWVISGFQDLRSLWNALSTGKYAYFQSTVLQNVNWLGNDPRG